jgi:DNA repair protein RecN (Recombination protein N)
MLRELAVRDLALIERVRVALGPGLTVITGETGAGKSLLIDALGLVMGARADSTLVRHGAPGARVEAILETDEATLICVRELSAEGRSLARIDDETVTAGHLAGVVGPMIEIHGQHEQQRLLSAAWQRDVLDEFGGHAQLRERVVADVRALRANEAALRELEIDPGELERRLELARHAVDEIESAAPQPGESDELRGRLTVLGHAQRIAALLEGAYGELAGEGIGARDRLATAARDIAELARLDTTAGELAERLAGLEAEAADLALELRRRAEQMDEAVEGTAQIEARLGVLYGLLRKYGQTEAAVIEYGERARTEVERLRGMDAERRARTADAERLLAQATASAGELSSARRATANGLAGEVTQRLVGLGFPSAALRIEVKAAALDETGVDAVEFLFAPNPGEPARELARIASGGELSRVALAIKTVLAHADRTPTLIFDEIDAGIGGRSADPVGQMLWRLARDHQVVCVTHLPQIAAYADAHLRIEKQSDGARTTTSVEPLEGDARRHELAQMLGGIAGQAATLAAADALLERAGETTREVAA